MKAGERQVANVSNERWFLSGNILQGVLVIRDPRLISLEFGMKVHTGKPRTPFVYDVSWYCSAVSSCVFRCVSENMR